MAIVDAQVGEKKGRPCEGERKLKEYRERESLKGYWEEKVLPFDRCICFSSNNIQQYLKKEVLRVSHDLFNTTLRPLVSGLEYQGATAELKTLRKLYQ